MFYQSTRGGDRDLPFKDTVLSGLARDGGLMLPDSIPDVSCALSRWRQLSYEDLAFEIMRLYADDIPSEDLKAIVRKSYATFRHSEVTPVVEVCGLHILELFHGPTLAFKDLALQFLGNLFEYTLEKRGDRLNIVAATSGDTGSAAIHGVRGRKNINIFVLHPHNRVSPVQELQMTSALEDNVRNLALDGAFDDCQAIVKALFADLEFRDKYHLGAVNSINWARVMAQITYYFYAAFRVMDRTGSTQVNFTVPTGNFGDVFAGYCAKMMGLPIKRLILATNENDILTRCFESGSYRRSDNVTATLSPSMDIQIASNFERYLYYRSGCDGAAVRQMMEDFRTKGEICLSDGPLHDETLEAGRGARAQTLESIRRLWRDGRYLIDPHTAVGVAVATPVAAADKTPMICLATAHPAKFDAAIREALGENIASHPVIDSLNGAQTRCVTLPASKSAVASFIEQELPKMP